MTRKRYQKLVRAYLVSVAQSMDNVACRKELNKLIYKNVLTGYNGIPYAARIEPLRNWLRENRKARV